MYKAKPVVTVGIPTYNRPNGLRRTLECITGQTYTNLEIIVSDNCSPSEDTEKIVREYLKKDLRIRYYRQSYNKGAVFNAAFVLEKSNSQFFMWATDDDEWYPEFIEKCVHVLLNNESVVLCTTMGIIISDIILQKRNCDTFLEKKRNLVNKNMECPYWLCLEQYHNIDPIAINRVKQNIIHTGNNLSFYGIYRSQIVKKIFFDNSFDRQKFGADRSFIARINLQGMVYQIQEPLFVYHHGLGASSGNALTMKNDISRWEYYGLRINPLLTAYLNMIFDSLSWPVSITDHIRVIGYYLARMAKAKILRYTMKTPFIGTPLYDYKPPEYPKRE